jgi:hypothetical protein
MGGPPASLDAWLGRGRHILLSQAAKTTVKVFEYSNASKASNVACNHATNQPLKMSQLLT